MPVSLPKPYYVNSQTLILPEPTHGRRSQDRSRQLLRLQLSALLQWKKERVPEIEAALAQPPHKSAPLGMYLHIPFCRKRCKFCYFRVYTQQNADMVKNYVEALDKEVTILKDLPGVAGRSLEVVYFGGGTPSYLSAGSCSCCASG